MSLGFTRGSLPPMRPPTVGRAAPPSSAVYDSGSSGGTRRPPPQTVVRVVSTPSSEKVIVERGPLPARTAPLQVEPTPRARPLARPLCGLLLFNLLLFAVHLAGAIVAGVVSISFPLTIFETRLNEDAISNFTCIYDFADDADGEPFCSDPTLTSTGTRTPSAACKPVLNLFNQTSRSPFVTSAGGPLVAAYELRHLTVGDVNAADPAGVEATRWILFTIEVITCVAHLLYALTFARILVEMKRTTRVFDKLLFYGGIPARWIEYSLTAALMSFFIGNTANVFDLYALVGFALGTFALMYFGLVIEHMLVVGRITQALMLLYVPSMALFALTWLPPIRQLWTDILRLSCVQWQSASPLSCPDLSCFGAENPIAVFVVTLIFLFCIFPLVLLFKIYYVGGWAASWGRRPRIAIRRLTCVRETRGATLPLFWLLYGAAQLLMYVFFVAWVGWLTAVYRLIADVLWPVFPCAWLEEPVRVPPADRVARGLLWGEFLYAVASVTAKIFLLAYFLATFGQRDW